MTTQTFDAAIEAPGALDHDRASELRSVAVSSLEDFEALRPQLEALCDDLCEENVFYEPWMVAAALAHIKDTRDFTFVCFYERVGPERLCGFFPLMRGSVHPLLPLQTYKYWSHAHCFRCTPLIRKGFALACWDALFDWLERQPAWRRLLHLRKLPADGEVERALRRVLEQRPALRYALLEHESAFLHVAEDSQEVLRRAMSGTTLGKLRRQQRRLAERGELVFAEVEDEPDLDHLLDQFLTLEASGWKGKQGTALSCDPSEEAFFRSAINQAQAFGRLSFLSMRLGNTLLAAQSSLRSRDGSFLFKTTYDESYAKYSPGILLEIEHLHRMHGFQDPGRGKLRWADSCSGPEDGPVYRCWPERRTVREYRIACGNGLPALIVVLWPLLRRIYLFLQKAWKDSPAQSMRANRLITKQIQR